MGAPIPHALFDSQLGLTKGNNMEQINKSKFDFPKCR